MGRGLAGGDVVSGIGGGGVCGTTGLFSVACVVVRGGFAAAAAAVVAAVVARVVALVDAGTTESVGGN